MHFVISTQTQYKDICHTQNDFRPALFWHKIRLSLFAKTGNIKSYRKNIDKPHEFVFEGWYCLWILILLRPAAFGFGFSGCLKAVCLSGVTSTYFFSFVLLYLVFRSTILVIYQSITKSAIFARKNHEEEEVAICYNRLRSWHLSI